jgi:enoyl-CoA hydratase/carnithine racemase
VSGSWRSFEVAEADGVATVVLDRPERLNAYNLEMRDELWELTAWLAADTGVSVCVFAGAGRAFCSGADLTEFGTAPSVVIARMVRRNRPVWTRILELPQVTIAALHGYVLGAGLELALACDLRFVARDALLGMPETGLGFVPPAGGTQLLPRTVGVGLAKRMLYTRERVAAEDAVRIGLASRLAADREAVLDEAKEAARVAALIPAPARARLKAALRLH